MFDDPLPVEDRAQLEECPRHGLYFDPASESGCVECQSEARLRVKASGSNAPLADGPLAAASAPATRNVGQPPRRYSPRPARAAEASSGKLAAIATLILAGLTAGIVALLMLDSGSLSVDDVEWEIHDAPGGHLSFEVPQGWIQLEDEGSSSVTYQSPQGALAVTVVRTAVADYGGVSEKDVLRSLGRTMLGIPLAVAGNPGVSPPQAKTQDLRSAALERAKMSNPRVSTVLGGDGLVLDFSGVLAGSAVDGRGFVALTRELDDYYSIVAVAEAGRFDEAEALLTALVERGDASE